MQAESAAGEWARKEAGRKGFRQVGSEAGKEASREESRDGGGSCAEI